jgi:hypothetical protein
LDLNRGCNRRLEKIQLNDDDSLHSSVHINRVIKFRMRWAEHAAYMGEMKNVHIISAENVKGQDDLRSIDVNQWIIIIQPV